MDPARETLERVVSGWLDVPAGDGDRRRGRERGPSPIAADTFLTTGDPAAMARAARLAFGVTLPSVAGIGRDLRGLG